MSHYTNPLCRGVRTRQKTFPRSFTSLTTVLLLTLSYSANASAATEVGWSNDSHQHYFADINGDGVSDLLLQANTSDESSSLILGEIKQGDVNYLASNQTALPSQIAGYEWDATQARLVLADFNGDGQQDLLVAFETQTLLLAFFGHQQGLDLTHSSDMQYTANTLLWLDDIDDYSFDSGDFNGDGRQDLLVISEQKNPHYLVPVRGVGPAETKFLAATWQDGRYAALAVRLINQ